jgi:hypothetical protein
MRNCEKGDKKYLILHYFLILISYFILFVFFASCGKKGEPTLKSYEKPDPPSNLRAIHRESDVILLWDFPKNKEKMIKGFYLTESISPPLPLITPVQGGSTGGPKGDRGDFMRIFLEPDKRTYTNRDFNIGTRYTYKILSQSLKDITSIDSNIIEIEPQDPPLPPQNPVYKIEYDSLTLTWEGKGNVIFYNIYKSEKKGVYPLTPLNTEPIKETSFKDRFDINKTVYYSIRSLRGGTLRDEGPPSEEIGVNPREFVPTPPEGIQALPTQEGVQLMWKEAPETWVIGYRVYRETDKKEGFIFIGETSVPAYFDSGKPSTKRSYRVTALGPSKEGPAAEIRDVVFIPYK